MSKLTKKPCAVCGAKGWPTRPATVYGVRETTAGWVLREWICELCARRLGHSEYVANRIAA